MTASASPRSPWTLKRKSDPEAVLANITFGNGMLYEMCLTSSALRIQAIATKHDTRVFFSRELKHEKSQARPQLIISTKARTMGLAQGQRFFGFLDGSESEYLLRKDPKTGAGEIALRLPQDTLERLPAPQAELTPGILEPESEVELLKETKPGLSVADESQSELALLKAAPLGIGFSANGELEIEGPGFRAVQGAEETRIYCYSSSTGTASGSPWCGVSLPSNQASRVHLFGRALGKCASLLFGDQQLVASNSHFIMETLL